MPQKRARRLRGAISKQSSQPLAPYAPTERESGALAFYEERERSTKPAPRIKVRTEGKTQTVDADHESRATMAKILCAAFGGSDTDYGDLMVSGVIDLAIRPNKGGGVDQKVANGVLATVTGIAPRNEVEGMLALQMVATHLAAIEMTKRAMLDQPNLQILDSVVNRATKLLRTFTAQAETLNRLRNGGKQHVTVQHQHVGVIADKAVVGINAPAMVGGGGDVETEGQPHAKGAADSDFS